MYTFVRSQEANRAIQAVTFEQLIQEQIARNGDSDRSNASQYSPYSFDAESYAKGTEPAGRVPLARANFLSGTDTNSPTKLDRVLALKQGVSSLVQQIKDIPIEDIVSGDFASEDNQGDLLTDDPNLVGSGEGIFDDLLESGG
jgi:hypothetical protein